MTRSLFVLLLAAAVAPRPAAAEAPTPEEMRKVVEAGGRVFSEGVRHRDFESIAALYSDTAKYGKDDEDFVIGRAAIREDWRAFVANPELQDLVLEPASVQGSGSVIYETGRGRTLYRTKDGKEGAYKFKYVNVWVRQNDGTFKLDVDFYNGLP